MTTSPPTTAAITAVNASAASTIPSTEITISSTTANAALSTLTTTDMKTTVETAPTTQDKSTEKTTAPAITAKDRVNKAQQHA